MIRTDGFSASTENCQLVKSYLSYLDNQFSTAEARIDRVTWNSSRLTKVYGSVANKGENNKDRPHRKSKIVEVAVGNTMSTKTLHEILKECTKQVSNDGSIGSKWRSSKKVHLPIDTEELLETIGINFKQDEGNEDGHMLYKFEKCPLRNHRNNTNGAVLITDSENRVQFKCLHESCYNKDINDLLQRFKINLQSEPDVEIAHPVISADDLLAGEVITLPGRFKLSRDGVFKGSKKLLSSVFITSISHSLVTSKTMYKLSYLIANHYLTVEISGALLNDFGVKNLSSFGIDVSVGQEKEVLSYFIMQKKHVKTQFLTTKVGWQEGAFQLQQSYSKEKQSIDLRYTGRLDLSNSGSIRAWKEMVDLHCLGTPMEVIIAIAFTSIVVGYLRRTSHPDLSCPVINLYGATSTSKSTSLGLIGSCFGNASKLIMTFNDTQNSLLKVLEGNFGIPQCIDELSSSRDYDLSSLIYQLSSGRPRQRLTGSSEFKESEEFGTVIITSSEVSIASKLNSNVGLKVRTLEFPRIVWSKDAETAEEIKRLSNENRGIPAIEFISKFFDSGEDVIGELFETNKSSLLSEMPESPTKGRVAVYLSSILTAGELAKKYLNINLDIDYIKRFLLENEQQAVEARQLVASTFEEQLFEILIRNVNKISINSKVGSIWGYFKLLRGKGHVYLFKGVLEELLVKHLGAEDGSPVIRELIEKKVILTESDRRTKRKKNGDKVVPVYDIALPDAYCEFFTNESVQAKQISTVNSKNIIPNNDLDVESDF